MLQFNSSGLLVPDINIKSTLPEFEQEFVTNISSSTNRRMLYNNFITYSDNLKNLCGGIDLLQWIDGSFVTKIPNPGDIDLVTFIDYEIINNLKKQLQYFIYPNSLSGYNVDAYIVAVYAENDKKYHLYHSDRLYWMDRFDKTRRIRGNRRSKGFIEIIY